MAHLFIDENGAVRECEDRECHECFEEEKRAWSRPTDSDREQDMAEAAEERAMSRYWGGSESSSERLERKVRESGGRVP